MQKKNIGWSGSLGFVMASAGAAVGMGNLWRFPTLVGQNGGGAFVLVYLICVLLIGIPMLMAEISIGRHLGRDAWGSYGGISRRWRFLGLFAVIISLIGLSYYSVLGGWLLRYIGVALHGTGGEAKAFFEGFTADANQQIIFYSLYMLLTLMIVIRGVSRGIEKTCKVLMPVLFLFLLVLAVRSCTLPGAAEGIRFFLMPDFSKITPKVCLMALGQVFFSLSVGAGAGITYGAYLGKQEHIPKTAGMVAGFDTLAAFVAGMAILPAVFSAGKSPDMGPGLIFVILPEAFAAMPGGSFFAFIFFILVLFASVTTTIAFMEVVVAFFVQTVQLSRIKSTLIVAVLATSIGVPCALSFGQWEKFKIFGKTFFELADYCVSNVFLPISAILTCIFIGWVWKIKNAENEVTNQGTLNFRAAGLWSRWIKYVLPVFIFLILLSSLGVF